VTDWNDLHQIRDLYLPDLSRTLENAFRGSRIRHLVFWNPMVRGAGKVHTRPGVESGATPTASFARFPHIDTDVGAYPTSRDLVDLFQKNSVGGDLASAGVGGSSISSTFPTESIVDAIDRGCRFSVVNAWRNIGYEPVSKAPLALLSPRYRNDDSHTHRLRFAFPDAAPDMERSRWYAFSHMTPEEVLLFCQYDRDASHPSDIWHCALTSVAGGGKAEEGSSDDGGGGGDRRSIDVRCLIVFDEIVPEERDRFAPDRTRSFLTQKQSADFCSEQARRKTNPERI